jgi:hypothetical protein
MNKATFKSAGEPGLTFQSGPDLKSGQSSRPKLTSQSNRNKKAKDEDDE